MIARQFTSKTVLPMILIAVVITPSLSAQIATGQSSPARTSHSLSSFGVISPLLTPTAYDLLPLTGICADYLLLYDSGSPENWYAWDAFWLKEMVEMKTKGYNVPMLNFHFTSSYTTSGSLYDEAKFDRVLDIFTSAGLSSVIASHFNEYPTPQGDSESQLVWDGWIQFTKHHIGDSRIAAVDIYNEPSLKTMTLPNSSPADRLRQTQYFADLTRAIHQIDPNRVVVFPPGFMYWSSFSAWLNDLEATGILNEPNVAFDVHHPYYWDWSCPYPWDAGTTPEQKAANYMSEYFTPLANRVGYNRVWCGGTSGWADGTTDDNLQRRWVIAMTNEFVDHNIGFTITPCFGTPSNWQKNEEALLASNYGK